PRSRSVPGGLRLDRRPEPRSAVRTEYPEDSAEGAARRAVRPQPEDRSGFFTQRERSEGPGWNQTTIHYVNGCPLARRLARVRGRARDRNRQRADGGLQGPGEPGDVLRQRPGRRLARHRGAGDG